MTKILKKLGGGPTIVADDRSVLCNIQTSADVGNTNNNGQISADLKQDWRGEGGNLDVGRA